VPTAEAADHLIVDHEDVLLAHPRPTLPIAGVMIPEDIYQR